MILLICDHKKRELFGLKQLQKNLISKGAECRIINKHNIIRAFNYYRPKAIIFPHTRLHFAKAIDKLKGKTIIVLVPSEHCALKDDFINVHYLGKYKKYNLKSSHKKVDFLFVQGEKIKKYLLKKKIFEKNKIIVSGHLGYNFWFTSSKNLNNKSDIIGIALTNELATKRHNNKNFLKTLYEMDKEINFYYNPWRMFQLNYDLFYLTIIFELLRKILNKFKVSLRTHVVDAESKYDFINSKNFNFDNNPNVYEWIKDKKVIISTFSFMNIDSYIFKKPHISLLKMIPDKFYFNAYNSFNYKEFSEPNSYTPKNFNELLKILKNVKFKKNKSLDIKLKQYYNYPNKLNPVEIISNNLIKILNNYNKKFINIELKKDNILRKIFGIKFSSLLNYQFAEIYNFIRFRKNSKNWYFDFLFK